MSRIKEVICICCPCGCHLQVDPENDYNVTGNACPNGAAYGREELTHPTRILTSTVRAEGGLYPRCPVKTAQAVPKEKMTEVMARWTASPCTPPSAPDRWCWQMCAAPAWTLWQREICDTHS